MAEFYFFPFSLFKLNKRNNLLTGSLKWVASTEKWLIQERIPVMFSPIPPRQSQDILTQEEAKCFHDNSSMSHSGLL